MQLTTGPDYVYAETTALLLLPSSTRTPGRYNVFIMNLVSIYIHIAHQHAALDSVFL